ncbi:NEDD8-activating protein uba3 [Balamuthia mandrillaris]
MERTPPAQVLTDVTATATTARTVRKDLGEAPPPEVPGDVFDRQRVMVDWDQAKIEGQRVLVLGTGGLGSSVAMALCRLGVERVHLLDCDTVDASNLNRQILFTPNDVGRRKVEAARDNLLAVHNLRSALETSHVDAVHDWQHVAGLFLRGRSSNSTEAKPGGEEEGERGGEEERPFTAVFNCIDYGAVFDYAVNAVCKRLALPYVLGSSYANTILVNYFGGGSGQACWACLNETRESFLFNRNSSKDILEWLRRQQQQREEEEGGRKEGQMQDDGEQAQGFRSVEQLIRFQAEHLRMSGPVAEALIREALSEVLASSSPSSSSDDAKKAEEKENEFVLSVKDYPEFAKRLHGKVIEQLHPDKVLLHDSLSFIPKDESFPTRHIGSWVCVCTGAALMMVNAWAQALVSESGQFPNFNSFTLNFFVANNSAQDGADGTSDSHCVVCRACSSAS